MRYKLDENKNVVKCSLEEWVEFIEGRLPTNHKYVGYYTINGKIISTVFLGVCDGFGFTQEVPIVFETMVFDKNHHGIYQKRYSTWTEAEEGHKRAITWVENGCKIDD